MQNYHDFRNTLCIYFRRCICQILTGLIQSQDFVAGSNYRRSKGVIWQPPIVCTLLARVPFSFSSVHARPFPLNARAGIHFPSRSLISLGPCCTSAVCAFPSLFTSSVSCLSRSTVFRSFFALPGELKSNRNATKIALSRIEIEIQHFRVLKKLVHQTLNAMSYGNVLDVLK